MQYTNSKTRHSREAEKNERLEAQRKERELRNQQAIEVHLFPHISIAIETINSTISAYTVSFAL